jgi:two-component system sensor histidine kinase KdpD
MNEASDDFLAEAAGRWPPPPGGRALAATLALVGATGLAAKVAMTMLPAHVFAPEILPLIFLVAVLISAVLLGFWCGLIAAITGFAALNFLFTEPLYTFHIARFADLVALVEFLLVAAFSGFLAGRLHDRVLAAQARAEALAVLGDLSAALAEAETVDQALKAALPPLTRLCKGQAIVVTPFGTIPEGLTLDPATQAACERALRSQQPQPAAAPGWEGSTLSFLPLAEGVVLGHVPLANREAPMREAAIAAMARQLRLALQRLDFAGRAREERLRAEVEATRAAVLASLGHDLRTPLATILGAASSLRELDLSAAARDDLLTAIEEEAARLNVYVSNLLQLSRLELAAPPRRVWVDLGDLVTSAATRLRRAVKGADLRLNLGALPMIQSEGGLIEQAVFNLMDNALSHGHGPVTLSSHETATALTLTIADQGPGLSPALRDWLHGPDLRPPPGQSGLGLAVAKGIARHLGGSLAATDNALTLSLPK